MIDLNQELPNENLTQKDIMQFLLHSTQHTATREELQDAKKELKNDIANVKKELKSDIAELRKELKSDIAELRKELKDDIAELRKELKDDIGRLDKKINQINSKFDRLQWLIVATIITIFLKDYILTFFHAVSASN